jgi:flavin-dependent dehydrogenase
MTNTGEKIPIGILGAGTAGLSAACLISRNPAFHVSLYERRRTGRRYGDSVQSLRNYTEKTDILQSLASYGLLIPEYAAYPVYRQVRIFPDGSELTITSPGKPSFYNIIRGERDYSFDRLLLSEASSRVDLRVNTNIARIEDVAVDFRFVISARGSAHIPKGFVIRGFEFQGIAEGFPDNTIIMMLDYDLTPAGYIAAIPFKREGITHLTIAVAYDFSLVKRQIDSDRVFQRVVSILQPRYLKKLELNRVVNAQVRGGFLKLPRRNICFIGEEFGALDSGLAFGNVNSIKTALAAQSAVERNDMKEFMRKVRELGLMADLERGLVRRLALRRMTNSKMSQIGQNLVRALGREISYDQYLQYKNSESEETSLKYLLARVISKIWLSTQKVST